MLNGIGHRMGRILACLWICGSPELLTLVTFAQSNSYEEARGKYQSKQYQEALPLAEKALREDSENPAKLDLYGSILAAMAGVAIARWTMAALATPISRLLPTVQTRPAASATAAIFMAALTAPPLPT